VRRDSLLRSTPFRLALSFTLVFIASFLVAGTAVYRTMKAEFDRRQDQMIQESFTAIADSYEANDMHDLIATLEASIKATRRHERIFRLTSRQGRVLAGNIPPVVVPTGWSDLSGALFGLDREQRYRVFAGDVDGDQIVVGLSRDAVDTLQDIMLTGFVWAALALAALAMAGGVTIAIRAQWRLDAVREAMDRVSHGELSARIRLLGKGDDIDLLSRDINAALARLETSVEAMRQVSSDIAHDLKTPLNRLRMTVEEAQSKQSRDLDIAEELQSAADEAAGINRTFEALLRIAQIESGARKARFRNVDLAEVLASIGEIYREVAEDSGQTLTAAIDPSEPGTIAGDRELLTQMFANLVENAIRHSPAGTHIRLSLTRDRDRLRATVEDDGPGIPEHEHPRVLQRLYRLEKSRTSPGSGLGLSLVKAVADLHNATLRLEGTHPGLRVIVGFAKGTDGKV
jgi:signal transduction histidine kinase